MAGRVGGAFVSHNGDVVVARNDLGDCDASGGETIRVERQALDTYVRATCVTFGQAVSIARLTGGGRPV